jgi:hypothetical protein
MAGPTKTDLTLTLTHRAYRFDEKARIKNNLINFAYMAAAWAPHADEETLITMIDWLHWTFYFDDRMLKYHHPRLRLARVLTGIPTRRV